MPENFFFSSSNLIKESSTHCKPSMRSGAPQSISGISIKIYKRPPMVCRGLLSIHLPYFCVEYFQAMNTLIKRKEKVDVDLLCKRNTCFLFHLCLSLMSHSLPKVLQQPEYPSREACVLMDWHHGRNWHQRKNMIMNWHCADLWCRARNKRYFKTLELSTEHLTAEYEATMLPAVCVHLH